MRTRTTRFNKKHLSEFVSDLGIAQSSPHHPVIVNLLTEKLKVLNANSKRKRDVEEPSLIHPLEIEPQLKSIVVAYIEKHQLELPKQAELDKEEAHSSSSSKLISLLGRKESRKFVVTKSSGEALSKKEQDSLKKTLGDFKLDYSFNKPMPRTPKPVTGEARAWGTKGTPYKQVLTSASHRLYIQESPEKNHNADIKFSKPMTESPSKWAKVKPTFFDKKISFDFVVTPEVVKARAYKKRTSTQLKVAGASSEEIMRLFGAEIVTRQSKAGKKISQYHLAHRQGWAVGGQQETVNLDPATAGSNYTTLFYVEDPLRNLIMNKGVGEVRVTGEVIYHPELGIPQQITYKLSWGNGRTAEKTIHPLNYRGPTLDENILAKAVLSETRTPAPNHKRQKIASSAENVDKSGEIPVKHEDNAGKCDEKNELDEGEAVVSKLDFSR